MTEIVGRSDAMRWPETRRVRRGHDFYPPDTTAIPALYDTEKTRRLIAEQVIHLHYFVGGCDWWVVEYDPASGTGFGYACLGDPQGAEWGYMSLPELEALCARGLVVERDLDWTPRTVAWVGDCRAYRWNSSDGKLHQYTTDHTMGQQLRASGGVPVEVALSHDHRLLVGLRGATATTVRQVWIPDHDQRLTVELQKGHVMSGPGCWPACSRSWTSTPTGPARPRRSRGSSSLRWAEAGAR